MKVYMTVCSCRDWKPQFGASLGRMMYACGKAGMEVFFNPLQGTSVLPRARQLAMQDAINGGFTHFFSADDDMKFWPDLLLQLVARRLPVVGINYARKDGSGEMMACGLDGRPIQSFDRRGIEEAGWLPFGGILIDLAEMKGMELPWFETRWLPEQKDFMGEDYYFSMKARTHGMKLYVDHDASNKSTHVGDFEYNESTRLRKKDAA